MKYRIEQIIINDEVSTFRPQYKYGLSDESMLKRLLEYFIYVFLGLFFVGLLSYSDNYIETLIDIIQYPFVFIICGGILIWFMYAISWDSYYDDKGTTIVFDSYAKAFSYIKDEREKNEEKNMKKKTLTKKYFYIN
jgi:hypothetical protein